jgi:hypothetical protein
LNSLQLWLVAVLLNSVVLLVDPPRKQRERLSTLVIQFLLIMTGSIIIFVEVYPE